MLNTRKKVLKKVFWPNATYFVEADLNSLSRLAASNLISLVHIPQCKAYLALAHVLMFLNLNISSKLQQK